MIEQRFYVVVFESTHYAIVGEKVFKENGYEFDVIPTPREITHSCGLSIKFKIHDLEDIKTKMQDANISIKGIYEIQKIDDKKVVKEII